MEVGTIFGLENYSEAINYINTTPGLTIKEITEQNDTDRSFKVITIPEYSNSLKALKVKWEFEQWQYDDWDPRDKVNYEEWNEKLQSLYDDQKETFSPTIKSISNLITTLNELDNTSITNGMRICIKEDKFGSPLFFFNVDSVEQNAMPYEYTTDENFITEISAAPVQIGYYKISAEEFTLLELERQKLIDEYKVKKTAFETQMNSLLGENWRV